MKLRIKNTSITLQIIGWLQIIGGITGIVLMGYLMLNLGTITGILLLLLLVGIFLYSFSIYTGKWLLVDNDKKTGIILSIINQFVQVFQFCLFGFGFTYSSGVELVIGIQGFSLKFNAAIITSNFQMTIHSTNIGFLKINLMAVLILITLLSILKEFNNKKNDVSIDSNIVELDEI
ncbi:MAG: hypothetical protein P4L34_13385 [Paludibacter sp.]|nr:hypothetical protein [Paludibacter sp.]